jgi:hypothetical protein
MPSRANADNASSIALLVRWDGNGSRKFRNACRPLRNTRANDSGYTRLPVGQAYRDVSSG